MRSNVATLALPVMLLTRLIYASRAADALIPADHEQILEASRRNNGKVGVTGLLADLASDA